MPLMKTSGNFIIVDSIITVEVMLVGADENISPIAEKQNAASTMPRARMNGCVTVTPSAIPSIIGTREITIPKRTDASTSPKRIVVTEIGAAASLSKFLVWVSVGAITGATEVEAKNSVIP